MIQIGAIQILRAIAALMVVLGHAQNDALVEALRTIGGFNRSTLFPWGSGVDLFFVISGFVMVYSSRKLFGAGGGRTFVIRRLIRIVPLYWMITAIMLVILAYVSWLGKHSFPGISEIIASLGFVPFAQHDDGQPRPLVPHGWTLNYEMYFYLVFALALRFRCSLAVAATSAILILPVVMGMFFHPLNTALSYWSDPIILEFIIGMLIALIWRSGVRIKPGFAAIMLLAGIGSLALDLDAMTTVGPTDVDANGFSRLLGAGLPMAMIFSSAVLYDPLAPIRGRISAFFALVGDASYALYLFHPLAIIFARKLYVFCGVASVGGFWPLIGIEIALAIALAFVIHFYVEIPVTTALRVWIREGKNDRHNQAEMVTEG
jgi:peptidoglycan/LPS O-acetylase OafA/YrhL